MIQSRIRPRELERFSERRRRHTVAVDDEEVMLVFDSQFCYVDFAMFVPRVSRDILLELKIDL